MTTENRLGQSETHQICLLSFKAALQNMEWILATAPEK